MHEEESTSVLSPRQMILRFAIMLGVSGTLGVVLASTVLEQHQAIATAVFAAIIMGTLFFWNFRLAIAFLGLAVLIGTSSMTIPQFVQSSALEVILFLVGMMIVVGALRDLGFFTWVVQLIVAMPNISGKKFIAVTAAASALLACAVDEVTSIIFISTLIFQVCDRLKLNPTPYILIAVLATNVGSAGTMMGNPVGIFIGSRAHLSFGDFMMWSFPIMLVALALTIVLTLIYYRKELQKFDANLQERLARNLSLAPAVEVPYMRGLILLIVTICAIASHGPLEAWLGLGHNSILYMAPLVCAGVVMILKPSRARHYVEVEVDWWTLLFFMLLFAIAGTLEHTKVDKVMADYFTSACGSSPSVLVPSIMAITAVGSAFVDNVIFVAAFSSVIEQLSITIHGMPLWWALLFGACIGGNITMIGSTANIVALGMLEKKSHAHVSFLQWFKIGSISALLASLIAWGGIMLLSDFMPDRPTKLESAYLTRAFEGKNVEVAALYTPGAKLEAVEVQLPEEYSDAALERLALNFPALGREIVAYGAPDLAINAEGDVLVTGLLYSTGQDDTPILVVKKISANTPKPSAH